jgi:hypothetical protein
MTNYALLAGGLQVHQPVDGFIGFFVDTNLTGNEIVPVQTVIAAMQGFQRQVLAVMANQALSSRFGTVTAMATGTSSRAFFIDYGPDFGGFGMQTTREVAATTFAFAPGHAIAVSMIKLQIAAG